jgi:hypothetical protein
MPPHPGRIIEITARTGLVTRVPLLVTRRRLLVSGRSVLL